MRAVNFEIEFRVEDGSADLEMTVRGVPTLEGLQLLNAQLIADPRFRAGLTILVDLCALDASGLSVDAVQLLSAAMVERTGSTRLRPWRSSLPTSARTTPCAPTGHTWADRDRTGTSSGAGRKRLRGSTRDRTSLVRRRGFGGTVGWKR
jgi:hypothetical protein